jgi:hypothetical protein
LHNNTIRFSVVLCIFEQMHAARHEPARERCSNVR